MSTVQPVMVEDGEGKIRNDGGVTGRMTDEG